MNKPFKISVNTPAGVLFEDNIVQAEIKTPAGVIGILADHQPIIGSIVPSICFLTDANKNRVSALINSGIFKTDGKTLSVITDFFYFTDRLNESIFEVRKQKILQAIADTNLSDINLYEAIKRKIQKELEQLSQLGNK